MSNRGPPDPDGDAGPLVSIILPTRDRGHVIATAIASVQEQHYPHWELIIVDDGSSDSTAQSLAPFLGDERIHVVRQPPIGAAAARNHGLRLARAGIIAYLDSDNVWYPDFLASAVAAFRDPDVETAYGALVTDSHGLDGGQILFRPFDRAALLEQNFIDINTLVHRRELVDRYGGFDERLDRLMDWDLVLRYTADRAPVMLPVIAARYYDDDPNRISKTAPNGSNYFAVRRKWRVLPDAARHLRVLYAARQYPQPGATGLATEIQCMLRFGVHVEAWCETEPAAAYSSWVPVHRGTLNEAIAAARPDLVHIQWSESAHQQAATCENHALPMTARTHRCDIDADTLHRILASPRMQRVYLIPHQQAASGVTDPRVRRMTGAFDTTLFRPHPAKDPGLVVCTAAGLEDLQFVFALAKVATGPRFVIAANCTGADINVLRDAWRQSGTPAELMMDLPRDDAAALVARAAHYLHASAAGEASMVSIAEAMATGCHVLVREVPALSEYVADAGVAYRDMDHAAEILRRAGQWTDGERKQAWIRSVDRAFLHHADETVLLPLLEDWCEIAGRRPARLAAPERIA